MANEKESGAGSLNDSQFKFLACMMRNNKSKPDVNWDKVGAELGMTAKSAKERFRLMSIKMGWNSKPGDGAPPAAKKPAGVSKRGAAKAKGGKKTNKAQNAGSDDGEEAEVEQEYADEV